MSKNNRHRRATKVEKAVASAAVLGVGIALPLTLSGSAHAATVDSWDRIAECESNQRWNLPYGDFGRSSGGLQFQPASWNDALAYLRSKGYDTSSYPQGSGHQAYKATKKQQIIAGEALLALQGPGAWACNSKTGYPLQRSGPNASMFKGGVNPYPVTSTPAPAPKPSTPAPAPVTKALTAENLRAALTGGKQISNGKYATDSGGSKSVAVMQKGGAVYWTADMDIDCDGQVGTKCNKSTDPYFQPETAFTQSNGKPLNSETLPFVVVPLPSSIWNYKDTGLRGGDVVVMLKGDKMVFGVVGDLGPKEIIGEASYAAAVALGINPHPSTGGTSSGVTYITFPGKKVSPIESKEEAVRVGTAAAKAFLGIQGGSTPSTPSAPSGPVAATKYTVKAGDTLYGITKAHNGDASLNNWKPLYEANKAIIGINPDLIFPGQVFSLPSEKKKTYTVKSGDTLSAIAVEHNTSWQALYEANKSVVGGNPDVIEVGQELVVSGLPPAPAVSVPAAPAKPSAPVASTSGYVSPLPAGTYRIGDSLIVGSGGSMSRSAGGHSGLDLSASSGTTVRAVAAGTVVFSGYGGAGAAYGDHVIIKHADGKYTLYGHMRSHTVQKGDTVAAGRMIGQVGSTGNSSGPHLHFEVRTDATAFSAGVFVNPATYLANHGVAL